MVEQGKRKLLVAVSPLEWNGFQTKSFYTWVVENFISLAIKQLKWKMGECTAVKNGVFTSTNCVLNPTEKYLTSYIKFGLLKNRFQITYFKKKQGLRLSN